MRSLPLLSLPSPAYLHAGTARIMNGARTSTHVCTLHFLAKDSVFSGSRRNAVESNFLFLKNRLCRPRRCPLNSVSRPLSSDWRHVVVEDDLEAFLKILPYDLREILRNDPKRAQLLEVVLDLGRLPEAHYLGEFSGQYLRNCEVSLGELEYSQKTVGEFGADNRAGIEGTLHRISAIRSRNGVIVGMTCRVGRAVSGHIDMIHDLLQYGKSILFVGRPGVGKTTVLREIARVLSDKFHKRVVIVDTSNEIGGDGNIPHAAIGGARRIQVPDPSLQYRFMIEAIENHMPEVIIVDEISTEIEALACRSVAERGVMLISTAHGEQLGNIINNQVLTDLIGGIKTVTLGDYEARARRTQKSILERKHPPTFYFLIEMRERHRWVVHQTEKSVDKLLYGKSPLVEYIVEAVVRLNRLKEEIPATNILLPEYDSGDTVVASQKKG